MIIEGAGDDKKSQVQEELSYLRVSIDGIGEVINNVAARLSNVLVVPDPPGEKETDKDQHTKVLLATEIRDCRIQLDNYSDSLLDIKQRLQN